MKQIICVTLDENRIYTCSTNIIARSNENNTTQIAINLADCFCDYWVYMDFEKPDGTKVKTPKLNIVDNVAIYDIPNSVVDLDGELKAQIVLQKENGEVWKSTIKTYHVKSSINATDDIPEKEDFITEAQSILDGIENAVTPTIGENGNWYVGDRDTGKSSVGLTGLDGKDGVDGYTPIKGKDYFDGKDGVDGKDYVISQNDYEEIGSIVENNIQPSIDEIKAISEQAETIARGKATGYVFDTLEQLELWLQDKANVSGLNLGDNFYIRAIDVPDYWWDGSTKQPLEGEKPDFSDYVKNTDYATKEEAGVVKINGSYGIQISNTSQQLQIVSASNTQIDNRQSTFNPIVPYRLNYAVGSVLPVMTQEEYDNLETKDEELYYFIVEE